MYLSMKGITKIYPNGVVANDDVDFEVEKGEIHALMGENGAGKSTLVKTLFGTHKIDSGQVLFDGKDITNISSGEAIELGIGMVHQHFMLVESLKVYENVVIGMEPTKYGLIDNAAAIQWVNDISNKYNLQVDAKVTVSNLSVGMKQKVEIIKVLARGAKLLILDEPTAVLTPQETDELFEQLLLLKKKGITIIFISHKIKEVKYICDRLTVLRGGKYVGVMDVKSATESEISNYMVGREVILKVNKEKARFGNEILSVQNLTYQDANHIEQVKNVSFSVKRGQILGIAGVEGNGQNELVECLFGLLNKAEGTVIFDGDDISKDSIRGIRDKCMSFIPEDRLKTGVASGVSIWGNIISDRIDRDAYKKNKLLNIKLIKALASDLRQEFNILSKNIEQPVGMLSGGNMQKVVVAREMSSDPKVLIANQPTRGIDVGANEFIWKKIIELRDAGRAVILVSADLNEILELSDSILVMHKGEIAGYFEDAAEVDEKELGLYMLGIKKQKGD